jgi:MSHA biogenesis protein MshN
MPAPAPSLQVAGTAAAPAGLAAPRAPKPDLDDEAAPAAGRRDPAAPAPAPAQRARAHVRAREDAPDDAPARPASTAAIESKSVLPMEPDSPEAREARRAAALELATRGARMARLAKLSAQQAHGGAAHAKSKGKEEAEGMQESQPQRAENEYRRALDSLQEGRMLEAIASLQSALRSDPGHDAARQTLVGLLVEAGRSDDAIRELQLGLARDPRQPALAMLLARLQIEHGGSGIETLVRSLPYAGTGTAESAEYHGFLAGALQRQQRHREAVEQYQQALRAAPGNGVWWMGLGISLQADKRNADALDAYQRARASGALNADLQSFVERRIQLLSR